MKAFINYNCYLFLFQLWIVGTIGISNNNNNNKGASMNNNWNLGTSFVEKEKKGRKTLQFSLPTKVILDKINVRRGGTINESGTTNVSNNASMLTDDDILFLEKSLRKNVIFRQLFTADMSDNVKNLKQVLLNSIECVRVPKNTVLYQQGSSIEDDGGYVYIVAENNTCTVIIDNNRVPEPYGTITGGSIIGERSLLYHKTTRAATIIANNSFGNSDSNYDNNKENVKLYRIPGTIVQQIISMEEEDEKHNEGDGISSPTTSDRDEMEKIDSAIQQIAGVKTMYTGGSIIRQYENSRSKLWRYWSGTVLRTNLKHIITMMVYSYGVTKVLQYFIDKKTGKTATSSAITILSTLKKIWGYQMSLTTFTVTFYLNQAYTFWRSLYSLVRVIQGQLSNVQLLLAANAKRSKIAGGTSTYSPQAQAVLEDVASYARLFHIFMWAFNAKRFSILLTKHGLRTLVYRGIITYDQYQTLNTLEDKPAPQTVPATMKFLPVLEWMIIRAQQGCDEGHIRDPHGITSKALMDTVASLRGSSLSIPGMLKGRMPRAYAHMVQMLVDTFLLLSPWALFEEFGGHAIMIAACVAMLTFFYGGLLDLAKVFLDPLDNDEGWGHAGAVYMDLSTLIRETNTGSTIWKNSGSILPFST